MPGIINIKDIKEKENLNSFFSNYVTISEKLYYPKIKVVNNQGNNEFFKKNSNKLLTKIDLTVNNIYKDSINYLKNKTIPEGYCLHFLIVIDDKKIQQSNNLILSFGTDENNNKLSQNVLTKISEDLKVLYNKPIYVGQLTSEQIQLICKSDILSFYKTLNLNKTFLGDSPDDVSIIITDDKMSYKIDNRNTHKQKIDPYNHSTQLIILDVANHILSMNYIVLLEKDEDLKFLELCSVILNNYWERYLKKYKDINLRQDLFSNPIFDLNTEWIKDKKSLNILRSDNAKDFFKLLVGVLSVKEIKSKNLFTSNHLNIIQKSKDKFNQILQQKTKRELSSFSEWLKKNQ